MLKNKTEHKTSVSKIQGEIKKKKDQLVQMKTLDLHPRLKKEARSAAPPVISTHLHKCIDVTMSLF